MPPEGGKNLRIDTLRADLARAREKAAEWQARVRDLEKQVLERENMEIVRAVRGVTASPDELRELLDLIRTTKASSKTKEENEK